jgi:hypothetical protein
MPENAETTGDVEGWPWHPRTGILDRKTAAAIRRWALSDTGAAMTETELRGLSQRQALRRYITGYLEPTLRRLLRLQRSPEASEAGAKPDHGI